MQQTAADPNRFAQDLFRPLQRRYDLLEELLSFGQNGRWRREMVAHVDGDDPSAILDVATGTAGVALALSRRTDAHITGIDITDSMLRRGRERVAHAGAADRVRLLRGEAERLPFPDRSFDALDVHLSAAVRRRSRRDPSRAHARPPAGRGDRQSGVLGTCEPVLAVLVVAVHARRATSCGLCRRRSCLESRRSLPRTQHLGALPPLLGGLDRSSMEGRRTRRHRRSFDEPGRRARDVGPEAGRLSMERPAFYAARPGGWRDWWTLLHPPYTAWHLSYVVIGATPRAAHRRRAPRSRRCSRSSSPSASRPMHSTSCTAARCTPPFRPGGSSALGAGGLLIACALGIVGVATVGLGLLAFIAIGPLLVLGYNLELFGGWIHTDLGFAAAWGAFPVLVGYFVQAERLDLTAALGAAAALGFSLAQRSLSTPARALRRRVASVDGRVTMHDGTRARAERARASPAPRTCAQLALVGHGRARARIARRSRLLADDLAAEMAPKSVDRGVDDAIVSPSKQGVREPCREPHRAGASLGSSTGTTPNTDR